jgi:hypothetical protein
VRLQPISQTKTSELRNDDIFPFPNSRFYCLAALALYFLGRTEAGALVGLFFFYITFEFTLVSIIPLMTELLPAARATLMAFNVAALSFGRALGDLIIYGDSGQSCSARWYLIYWLWLPCGK